MNAMIRTCLCMALCFCFCMLDSQLFGQVVYSISGFVEPSSSTIPTALAGQSYVAEFEVDTSAVDTDPSSNRGLYPNAILSASIVFESGFTSEIDFAGGVITVQRNLAGGGVFLQDATMASTLLLYDLNNPFDTDALPTDPGAQFSAGPDSLVYLDEPTLGPIISFSNVDLGSLGPIVFAVVSEAGGGDPGGGDPGGGDPGGGDPVDPVVRGDCDLDGSVTFKDIQPMVDALASGAFLAQADCNADGAVNFLDINSFIEILMGS